MTPPEVTPPRSPRAAIKSALTPLVRAAWPIVEASAEAGAAFSRGGLDVRWASAWTSEFDAALAHLPPLEDCPHELYRALLGPTSARKRHALVSERGEPVAVISVRRRGFVWEPVAYQCIPFALAPARDTPTLGRALKALGLNIVIAAGLGDVADLNAAASWAYDWHKIDLAGDYEAYWRAKKRQYTISRARRHLAALECRIDGEGDLQWIVGKWREQWAEDLGQEIVAAEDRQNLWPTLAQPREAGALRVRTLLLASEKGRIGGLVFTTKGDVAMAQCGGREAEFDDGYLAAAFTVGLVDWARANSFKTIDMAGGEYKRHWGPVGGQRHGAMFRPPLIGALSWALPAV